MSDEPGKSKTSAKSVDEWKALVSKELKGADADSLTWASPEGIDIKALYTGADVDGIDYDGLSPAEALPGFPPFVRGVRGSMYANRRIFGGDA